MEAASRGSADEGGLVLGVLPGDDASEANPWVTIPLPTGMGEARNALVVRFSEGVVAVGGGWGTLSEVALAKKMGIPLVALGPPVTSGVDVADTAGEAVERVVREALDRRRADRR